MMSCSGDPGSSLSKIIVYKFLAVSQRNIALNGTQVRVNYSIDDDNEGILGQGHSRSLVFNLTESTFMTSYHSVITL